MALQKGRRCCLYFRRPPSTRNMEANVSDELIEAMARIIDPSSWRVMDGYLAQMLRKYKGEHIGYDPDAFKHKESMAIARAILPVIRAHLEPTSEMLAIGNEAVDTCTKVDPCDNPAKHIWADMLAASPIGDVG
jgi:hypothetical protein